jgi:hypothetical protein
MITFVKERKLFCYSNKNSQEFKNHYEQMQQDGWLPIDERVIVDDGYEVEYEKWYEE